MEWCICGVQIVDVTTIRDAGVVYKHLADVPEDYPEHVPIPREYEE